MIETWKHGLALLTAPSAELFAQAYRSPSLSSSSYFSWAHSPEARMPSYYAEKANKYYICTNFLCIMNKHNDSTKLISVHCYDNETKNIKELFKLHDDYLQCSQLWTSKVPTSSMSHRPCQWPWYQQLPASATVLPTEAPYPKRCGTSMKGPDCEDVGRGRWTASEASDHFNLYSLYYI